MNYRLLIIFSLFFQTSCLNNPLWNEDTARDTHIVRGHITLQQGDSPENVYVWLEDLHFYTRTNSTGEFKLELPRSDELNGYNNDLKLYYYVGNYAVQYSNVLLVNGVFQFDKYDINNEGFIKETVQMQKLLDITTTIEPDSINSDYTNSVIINVNVTNLDSNLLVICRMTPEGVLGGYIFRRIGSPPTDALQFDLPGTVQSGYILNNPVTWGGSFSWPQNLLPAGTYLVYPYIYLRQEELPQELLASFGFKADQFNADYLKIPFTHKSAIFTVH